VLRHDQRMADMPGGNDISATTVRRWRDEIIGLLAAKAPRLDRALKKIAKRGGEVVLIDGTLIPTQRRTGGPEGEPAGTSHSPPDAGAVGAAGRLDRAPIQAAVRRGCCLGDCRSGVPEPLAPAPGSSSVLILAPSSGSGEVVLVSAQPLPAVTTCDDAVG
jgi:hypothetical protein